MFKLKQIWVIKRLVLLLLLASSAFAQTPVQTVAGSSRSQIITPKAAGDTLLVECNYQKINATGAITDSAGTVYTQQGKVNNSSNQSQIISLSAPLATAGADTVICPSGTTFGEIYIVELPGTWTTDGLTQNSGTSGTAIGTVATTAGDLVVAFCVTGACSNASGWSSLSTFDSNLATSEASTGTSVSASFSVSSSWILTLVSLKPATKQAYVWVMPGLGTVTFPMQIPPACGPSDGTCTIVIQVCDTATPPNCLTSGTGTISLIKTVSLPSPQSQTIPVAIATNP